MRFLRTVHKLKNGAVHKNETTVHMFEKTHPLPEKPQMTVMMFSAPSDTMALRESLTGLPKGPSPSQSTGMW